MGFLFSKYVAIWCLNGSLYMHNLDSGDVEKFHGPYCVYQDMSNTYNLSALSSKRCQESDVIICSTGDE